ncbi:phage regulatory CII family protein [Comamonas sp. 4034]|uniref:phage regulatory CII family protein n=1 Tax=Comamonas sp. 4034 TaxID=3156455 RepID=UPI003D1AD285
MSAVDCVSRGLNNYPGGRAAIRARLCPDKVDDSFRKELSGAATHKLGLADGIAIAAMCCELKTPHCYDLANFIAQECGGRFELTSDSGPVEQSPVAKVSTLVVETSHVTAVVIDSMQDGVISDNELAEIEREIAEAEEALRKLRQAARAVNAAGKPASERRHVVLTVRTMREEVPAA